MLSSHGTSSGLFAKDFEDSSEEMLIYSKISEYEKEGNSFEVHRLSKQFIKTYPESIRNARVLYLLGETETEFFKSVFYLRKVVNEFPTSHWAVRSQIAIALKYYTIGNYRKSEQEYKLFITAYPTLENEIMAKARYFRAMSLLQLNKTDEAHKIFSSVITGYPGLPWALRSKLQKGHICFDKKNYTDAIKIYTSALPAIKNINSKAFIMEKLGQSYLKKDDKKKGFDIFRELISLYPDSPSAKRAAKIYSFKNY